MESDIYPSHSRRRRSLMQPPDLSELRIVLLGKNSSEISRVGNFILAREAFDTEAPPPSVKQHSERAGGTVEGRYITLINTPHLFHPQLSEEELNKRVRECTALCSPGPHVLVLVLHPDDFTKQDEERSRQVLNSYSPFSMKYGIVIITKSRRGDSMSGYKELEKNQHLQHLVWECQGRSQNICRFDRHEHLQLLDRVNEIVRQNGGNHLICGTNKPYRMELTQAAPKGHQAHPTEPETAGGDRGGIKKSEKEKQKNKGLSWVRGIHRLTGNKAEISSGQAFSPSQGSKKMNLVLCGSNRVMKSSISDLILGQRDLSPESSSVCVKREAEVCGRLITLVELPALYNTYLSEEEVMRETLRCVSLCDPGVHAFLLVLPEGRLTDEDKGELEKIQRIFGPRLNSYIIFLINTERELEGVLDDAIKNMTETYQVPVYVLDTNKMKVLFQTIEQMLVQNNKSCYTVVTYSEAQIETYLKYKSEVEELRKNGPTHSSSNKGDLRIVLLGKTGVGKSASGNTILGKGVFEELLSSQSVTSMCQKESSKIGRRRVTVTDTPGLFDTNIPNEEITKEIAKCISMAAPGPHVFLLVLALGQRFTQEEKEAVKMIQDLFGEESRRYTMVLFTRGDDLRGTTIEKFIASSDRSLQNIIDQCGNRYHLFNNRNPEDQTQVTDLLKKIDSIVAVNGGSCYTNEMFQDVEKSLKQDQERILKERVKEIEREKEELRAKHEAEMEKLKTTLEEERQKQDEEKKKSEKEFREREEQIKEEFVEREQLERDNYNKRREEDEKRMKGWMADINREREENRKQWEHQREKHQRRIEEEEKGRKRKEEEWGEKQREEKEKFEKEKEEMIQKQRAHQRISLEEYKRMTSEEELSRRDLEEKIKHIEENKRKELLLAQQREWRRKKLEEEKRREEQEKEWREQMAIREKEWQLQQCQKQQQYEQERQMEMEKRVLEEKRRKQKEEEERIRIESKANEKIQQMQMQMEKRETEAKQKEQQLKEELQRKLKTQREIFYKLEEERARARKELEERNLAYIKNTHEREKLILRGEMELSARQEAEKKFCARLDLKVKEAKAEGYREGEMEGYRKGFAEAETAGFKSKQAKLKRYFVKSGKKQQPFD